MPAKKSARQEKAVKPKTGRGGARPNTGPKPLEPKIRRSVGLSARQWIIFDEAGGNDWLRLELDSIQSNDSDSV